MNEEDPNGGFEARLRWIAQQIIESAERLEQVDLEQVVRDVGIDVDRAQEFLEGVGQWLSGRADSLASEAAVRFSAGASSDARSQAPGEATGPHPLDLPTPGQGLALGAIDSGRWTVQPGSHEIATDGEGPDPGDPLGLVGELRARDWIDADGKLTLLGQNALKRWMEQAPSAS